MLKRALKENIRRSGFGSGRVVRHPGQIQDLIGGTRPRWVQFQLRTMLVSAAPQLWGIGGSRGPPGGGLVSLDPPGVPGPATSGTATRKMERTHANRTNRQTPLSHEVRHSLCAWFDLGFGSPLLISGKMNSCLGLRAGPLDQSACESLETTPQSHLSSNTQHDCQVQHPLTCNAPQVCGVRSVREPGLSR